MPDEKKIAKKLVNVVKEDDAVKLRYYIEKYKLSITRIKVGPDRQNLLHVACKYLRKNVIEFLMNKRGLLHGVDGTGKLPFHILMEELSSASSRKRISFAEVLSRMQRGSFPSFVDPFVGLNSFSATFPSFNNMFPSASPSFSTFHSGAFQRLSDFCHQFDPRRDTDEAWASKLAEEMQADHDEEWGRFTHEPEEPRQETYDDWANRIFSEYRSKHSHNSSSHTSKQNSRNYFTAEDQRKFEEAERELQRLRKEKSKRKEEKKYVSQKKHYETVCCRIKAVPNGSDAQSTVIKPSRLPELVVQPSTENIRKVFFCDIEEKSERRKYLKEQMKIWHPDKFLNKVRSRVAEKHVPEIEEIAKRFCQILTELLADMG